MNNLELFKLASQWIKDGHQVIIGTVINTWGSAPRPLGSVIIINQKGDFEGSVSGGCIEATVIHEAIELIATQQSKILSFGVSDDTAWSVGLSCGGNISVHLEPFGNLNELLKDLLCQTTVPAMLLVRPLIAGSAQIVLQGQLNSIKLPEVELSILETVTKKNQPQLIDTTNNKVFIQPLVADFHIIVVGAVHIAQHLVPLLKSLDFRVTLIDPRTAFANATRFPDVSITHEWPQEILPTLPIDHRTGLVTLTHDPKIDNPAILFFLKTNAFYVGCLGSKKTHGKRVSFLNEEGLSETQIEKISAPVGLDLGGRSPSEIALAIASEIVIKKYRGNKDA
jgi:xanthine dehydrogenase accessory factor